MINQEIEKQLQGYLREDIGKGDITSAITPLKECQASIKANQKCVLAGIEEAEFLFKSAGLETKKLKKDGDMAKPKQKILIIRGNNRKILALERVCLNIIGRMSGVATLCTKAKNKMKKTNTILAVTRKTIPGFQFLDKKAAEIAGLWSHRKNLAEMILIKDNHLEFFKSVTEALQSAKKTGKKTEIETKNQKEALEAAKEKPDMIMLDNFNPNNAKKTIKKLKKIGYKGKIELSGGITLKNLKHYMNIGADYISMGELTKNAKILDFSMDIEWVGKR
jgi:nicotinate-nucleotide pyrophosphorylase (carboxylating)